MTAAEQIVQRLVEGEDIDWSPDPEDPDASTTAARMAATEEYVVLGLLKNDSAPAANRYPGYTTRIEHVDYTSIATAENHIARYMAEHPTSEPAFNWRHMYDAGAIICETWQKGPHAPWGIKRVQRFVEGRGFVQPVTGNILESEEIDWAPDPEDPDAATRISPKAFSEIEKREVPDEFVDSYVSALLWTRNDEAEDGAALNVDFDIDEKTMAQMRADCQDFWSTNYEHIHDRADDKTSYLAWRAQWKADYAALSNTIRDMKWARWFASQAGTDFCLSRNRHGSGFWDREEIWGAANAKHLHEMSVPYGSFNLYAGADGKVYGQ